jgi:hypothetical protein
MKETIEHAYGKRLIERDVYEDTKLLLNVVDILSKDPTFGDASGDLLHSSQ